jgi:hypothetical protein
MMLNDRKRIGQGTSMCAFSPSLILVNYSLLTENWNS